MNDKLIVYELNEVPKKLINLYSHRFPKSTISYLYNNGIFKETITYDTGELHPWSTWPTLHRGVGNEIHKITSLNQDLSCAKDYPPVWEKLLQNNIDIGLFAPLQSYPPIKHNLVKFYLPDTFAPDSLAIPKELSRFQKFNLYLSNRNKAIPGRIDIKSFSYFFKFLLSCQLKLHTIFTILSQIMQEYLFPISKSRRSLLQPIIGFDVYRKLIFKYQPSYTSFFSNHVAGVMHKYWKYLFVNDDYMQTSNTEKFHADSIIKAMHIADKQLAELLKFSKKFNYTLLVMSSMGQDYIDRGQYIPELFLKDFGQFIRTLNLDISAYEILPAMQPDICIISKSIAARDLLRKKISNIKSLNNEKLIIERYKPKGLAVNFYLNTYEITATSNKLIFGNQRIDLNDIGLELINRDIGTGYHIPNGILMSYGKKSNFFDLNEECIDTRNISQLILDFYSTQH